VTTLLEILVMIMVGGLGLGVVLNRQPTNQIIVLSAYSLGLIALFVLLQAPDVALSAIVVGMAAYPVMVLLAIAKIRVREKERDE
jgi:uncharacterized MnhB-related membrane protein